MTSKYITREAAFDNWCDSVPDCEEKDAAILVRDNLEAAVKAYRSVVATDDAHDMSYILDLCKLMTETALAMKRNGIRLVRRTGGWELVSLNFEPRLILGCVGCGWVIG